MVVIVIPVYRDEAPPRCHPERSGKRAKRTSCAVEGSLFPLTLHEPKKAFSDFGSGMLACGFWREIFLDFAGLAVLFFVPFREC